MHVYLTKRQGVLAATNSAEDRRAVMEKEHEALGLTFALDMAIAAVHP